MAGIARRARPLILGWILRWSLLMALWLMLVDNAKLAELVTGAVAAGLAAAAAELAEKGTRPALRVRPGFLRYAWRPLLRLPIDTVLLAAELVLRLRGRRPRGRLRAASFRRRRGAEAAGRRVLAESLGSLAPNRYVIGIDPEREQVLVHELGPSDEPLDPLELG
jgi:multisubunit Na+/H+ antiporter MnhE subunit